MKKLALIIIFFIPLLSSAQTAEQEKVVSKAVLSLYVPKVVMAKKGSLSMPEREEEKQPDTIQLKNRHSAIESNIHALETRGLDRCPDRGYAHFKRYIGLGVCACNLCCIGRALMAAQKRALKKSA